MASVYEDILASCKSAIDGLGLAVGITPVPCVIRKLPKADETIDTLPLIVIAPSDPESVERISFEQVNIVYRVEAVIVRASNHNLAIDSYVLAWREKIRRLFQVTPLGATVWKSEVSPEAPFDRSGLNSNYDYSGITCLFHSVEQRTN